MASVAPHSQETVKPILRGQLGCLLQLVGWEGAPTGHEEGVV